MAFLAKAMPQVLGEIQTKRTKARERVEREKYASQTELDRQAEEARHEAEYAEQEAAFVRAFPTEESQCESITEHCIGTPFRVGTQSGRSFAIGKWALNRIENRSTAIKPMTSENG